MQQNEKIIRCGRSTVLLGSSNIGIYELPGGDAVLIDTGYKNDGRLLDAYLTEHRLRPRMILNTHSHSDHTCANGELCARYGIKAYTSTAEARCAAEPERQYIRMCGAEPPQDIAALIQPIPPVEIHDIASAEFPEGFEIQAVPGHSVADIAIRTPDGVWFLGDSVLGLHALSLCALSYITSMRQYIASLGIIAGLRGALFVPGHGRPEAEAEALAEANLRSLERTIKTVLEYCRTPRTREDVIALVMQTDGQMNMDRYLSLNVSVSTLLFYLQEQGLLRFNIRDGRMQWQANCCYIK